MKKEFIMPSLEMKKFSKEIVMTLSLGINAHNAKEALETNVTINKVAVINL